MSLPPLLDLGQIGQLIIREASFRICAITIPRHGGVLVEASFRQYWAGAPLRWCYESAGTVVRAFPAARYQR